MVASLGSEVLEAAADFAGADGLELLVLCAADNKLAKHNVVVSRKEIDRFIVPFKR